MMFIWMIAAATGPAVSAKDNNEQTLHDCRVLCVLMLLYLFPSDMLIDFNVIRKVFTALGERIEDDHMLAQFDSQRMYSKS